jgi:hypothetical protein
MLTGRKVSKEKKAAIVESITNKTMAQAETELFKLLPETALNPQSYERRISEDMNRMNMNFPDDVTEMMNRLKELWAHVDPTMDSVEVIRRSFKIALEKIDPSRRVKAKPVQKGNEDSRPTQTTQGLTESAKRCGTKRPTYYRREFDRALWEKAGSRCEFVDEETGRRCDCRFGLQREHVIPLALGGSNDLSNMQLLCATHNQLRARRAFGNKKIDAFQIRKR